MTAVRCIVKFGGAAITKKEEFETLNVEILDKTCEQLKSAVVNQRQGSIVVVHGAGSFGHFQASAGGVALGGIESQRVALGFVQTRISVGTLNLEVVKALAAKGLQAVGISPFSGGWSTSHRKLESFNTHYIERVLRAGLVPVLHGDAVLDTVRGCTILSGDVIIRQLAEDLQPTFVVFLTNVGGVYDRPPSELGAVLIKRINVAADGSWVITDPAGIQSAVQTASTSHDTTGGMATKIAEAASIAAKGVPVIIAEGGTEHALHALQGAPLGFHRSSQSPVADFVQTSDWIGTLIVPRSL